MVTRTAPTKNQPIYKTRKINLSLCRRLRNHFVIHFHQAKRTGDHYDIRLEHDCSLRSWASKKFPAALTDEKNPKHPVRIALFPTPDHALEYFDFHGKITSKYGMGMVSIWDTGTFESLYWDDHKHVIRFNGNKVKGVYIFLRLTDRTFLFFKKKELT